MNLKKEFQHHKDKIHEYNILIDAVSRTEGESSQQRQSARPARRRRRNKQLPMALCSPGALVVTICKFTDDTKSCCIKRHTMTNTLW